jgi:hypothetical protein
MGIKITALIATATATLAIALPATAQADPGPSQSPAAQGVEAPIGAIPWPQVGPGWMLAMWSPVTGSRPGQTPPPGAPTFKTASSTLYLVDPAGGRYAITTFPPSDGAPPAVVDWSGDGTHALLTAHGGDTAIIVDLHTGTQTSLPVAKGYESPRFTRPEGKAVLLTKSAEATGPAGLERVDLSGNPQLTYPTDQLGSTFKGSFLSTPDGTRLVLGTSAGLVMMGNDGTVGSTVSMPGGCSPLRWWDGHQGTTALASCGDYPHQQLWLVPVDGGTPTALTAPLSGKGPDYGDMDAWQLPAGTFVQDAGACGVIYLAKLNADGTTTPVSVPNVDSRHSIEVVGVNGGDLDLRASAACGGGESLFDYNPTAGTSTVLLGPPVNGGGVIDAVAYPGQK